ncbi:nitroreductase family protein [Neisseria perflava]|uniref:nitroreductase family protein n=1 Tax=Neisseria perflava TaxID=33053 RepID=UPI0020A02960|nr:nitroreductase family protein [Neisseria perflava]MCP1659580.1 nitroreductase [Neisseria perflava]MCP1772439.1 nitroreductase [Neisseria perflava]
MKNAVETMKNHRAFRHFKIGESMPQSDVQTIIDCARQAPSWMNGQHYTIINITDPELRAKISALQPANPQVGTCATLLIFIADLHRADLCSQAYGGSFASVGHSDSLITAVTDASLAAQNATVAAESLGYGTCYIGGIRMIAPYIIELLGLPRNTFPLFGLCIGTPDIEMRIKPRLPENTVYAENRYPDDKTLSDGLADYEKTMSAFAEARERLPYREKFARYYSSSEPKNEPLIYRQGWLTSANDEKV